MRRNHIPVGMLALVLAISCKSNTSAEAEGEAKANANAEAEADAEATAQMDVQPRIGGTIVAAGDYRVEVLAYIDGRIEALVMDAKGELIADPGDVDLAAKLAAEGDARAEVALKWDAPTARFSGRADADVQLVPGPVEVQLEVGGDAHVGQLAQLGLAVEATHGGQVMVAGDYAVELAAEGDFVHAYVFDASGQAHAKGELDLDLRVGADAGTELDLKWDPPSASYKAKVEGDFDLEAKPVVLEVAVGGKVSVAAVQSFSAKASAEAVADLDVDADADLDASASAKAPEVSARAKASKSGSAKAKVDVDKSASAKGSAKASGGKAEAKGKAKASFKFGIGK